MAQPSQPTQLWAKSQASLLALECGQAALGAALRRQPLFPKLMGSWSEVPAALETSKPARPPPIEGS